MLGEKHFSRVRRTGCLCCCGHFFLFIWSPVCSFSPREIGVKDAQHSCSRRGAPRRSIAMPGVTDRVRPPNKRPSFAFRRHYERSAHGNNKTIQNTREISELCERCREVELAPCTGVPHSRCYVLSLSLSFLKGIPGFVLESYIN